MYYILGGDGFIGSAFARYLKKINRPFQIINRENYRSFIGSNCHCLINANGNSSKIKAEKDPLWDFESSVKSVRSSLLEIGFEKYIYLSSCDIYSDTSNPENNREDTSAAFLTQKTYGFHKYLAELCVKNGAKDFLIFRLGGFVGEGLKKNAIYDILFGSKLWLHPKSRLQFLDTEDAAKIILSIADRNITNEIFNLCGDGLIQLDEVVEWCGRKIPMEPEGKLVEYNINIQKIAQYIDVPTTKETVLNYVTKHSHT